MKQEFINTREKSRVKFIKDSISAMQDKVAEGEVKFLRLYAVITFSETAVVRSITIYTRGLNAFVDYIGSKVSGNENKRLVDADDFNELTKKIQRTCNTFPNN